MRIGRVAWAGAGILALIVAACDDDDGGTTGAGTTTTTSTTGQGGSGGTTGTTGNPPTCEDDAGTLDIGGVWAGTAAMTVGMVGMPGALVSVCPAEQEGKATLLFLATIHQSGTDLQDVQVVVCDAELPSVKAVAGTCTAQSEASITTDVLLTSALRDALPGLVIAPVAGKLAETTAGAEVTFDRFVVTAGSSTTAGDLPAWKVEEPGCGSADVGRTNECEAMCVEGCASLRDDDMDTYPGVTLDVCGRTKDDSEKKCPTENDTDVGVTLRGRAFAAIRVDPQLVGSALSSCAVKGTVDAKVEYSVVGADVLLAGLPIPVSAAVQALPKLVVKPEESPVSMVRVDGKFGAKQLDLDLGDAAAACKLLREKKNEVF